MTGSVIIGSLDWQDISDLVVSEQCKGEHTFAQKLKELFGTRIILINATIAVGANEEQVAELLSTFTNSQIREAARKTREFFEAVEKTSKGSRTVSPIH